MAAERAKVELTNEEMTEVLREKVKKLYGLSLEDYLAARKEGRIKPVPGSASLEVFSGDAAPAPKPESARSEPERSS